MSYDSLVERYPNKSLLAQAHWSDFENTAKVYHDNSIAIRYLLDIFSEKLSVMKNLGFDERDIILTVMLFKRLNYSLVSRFEMEHPK